MGLKCSSGFGGCKLQGTSSTRRENPTFCALPYPICPLNVKSLLPQQNNFRSTSCQELRIRAKSDPQWEVFLSCLDFVSSDETLDRYDEIISAAGWKLSSYYRNPVFQNEHQH